MVGERHLLTASKVEQPDFIVAGAIGTIDELSPIRRDARVHVFSRVRSQLPLRAGRNLQPVKIHFVAGIGVGELPMAASDRHRPDAHLRDVGDQLSQPARGHLHLPQACQTRSIRGERDAPAVDRPGRRSVIVLVAEQRARLTSLGRQEPETSSPALRSPKGNPRPIEGPGGAQIPTARRRMGHLRLLARHEVDLPDGDFSARLSVREQKLLPIG